MVGVAPEGFQGTGILGPDVWLPLNTVAITNGTDSMLRNRRSGWLVIGARLKPGISPTQAAAEIEAVGGALQREHPETAGSRGLRLLPSSRVPGNRLVIAGFMGALMTVVALVLAVACANIAGLLLARSTARRREMAVRLSLGAGRGRITRQLLAESTMLFAIAGAFGVLLARAMTSLIPLLPSLPFPITVDLPIDGRVLAFTTGLSLLAALLSGLAPARTASQVDVMTALKDESQGPSGRSRLRSAFVVAQVGFSLVLVIIAGLFVRALQEAGAGDPGFDPKGVEIASLDLSMAGYTDATRSLFWRELIERVRQLPDVDAATLARVVPGGFEGIGLGGVTIAGARQDGVELFSPSWNIVDAGYFATLGIPLLAGRDFGPIDRSPAPLVAIVGESLARRFWPGQQAVGQLLLQPSSGPDASSARTRSLLVVGIARDIRSSSLIDGLSESFIYVPWQQHLQDTSTMMIVARSTRGQRIPGEIRALVASMDSALPVVASQTLEDSMALGLVPQRILASLSGTLGIVGVLLAAIGIYGLTAYSVALRTREIGIRIAMGARRTDVLGLVLRRGLALALTGCAIGLTLAGAASQVLAGFLFGVPPLHLPTFVAAPVLFVAIGLTACYIPARRATRIDPLSALRHE